MINDRFIDLQYSQAFVIWTAWYIASGKVERKYRVDLTCDGVVRDIAYLGDAAAEKFQPIMRSSQ